jgi:hypothetical protein
MTVEQRILSMLKKNGMFDTQAAKVLETIKADDIFADMKGRWNDSEDDYSPIMISTIWFSAKREALALIDKDMPNAWFRPMFAG